jgi:hypothetical protein
VTRKVILAIGFPRDCHGRRLVALIAIAALVLQTLLAGLAGAQATSAPADAIGVICHHDGSGGDPADAPDKGNAPQNCCVFCTAAAVAIVKAPMVLHFAPQAVTAQAAYSHTVIIIARTIVRAGRSQAPPRLA